MRVASMVLCAALGACGGGDEPTPLERMREADTAYAVAVCQERGETLHILEERYSHLPDGTIFDIGLVCRCGENYHFTTPLAVPGPPRR